MQVYRESEYLSTSILEHLMKSFSIPRSNRTQRKAESLRFYPTLVVALFTCCFGAFGLQLYFIATLSVASHDYSGKDQRFHIDLNYIVRKSFPANKVLHSSKDGGVLNHASGTRVSTSSTTKMTDRPDYYVIFSTSCSKSQDWESYVLYYHAMKVQQPGTVTRIVSGCSDDQQTSLQNFFDRYIEPMNPGNFRLHFTPDFGNVRLPEKDSEYAKYYKYMNKPFGVRHWMEHVLSIDPITMQAPSKRVEDAIVMLIDPDMILLRPLLHDFSDVDNHLWAESDPPTRVVRHGFPMAQQDGYLTNAWMNLDMEYITNKTKDSLVPLPPADDGLKYWSSGPPYLATVRDMYRIAVRWTEYAPRVLDIYPELYAEMKGLIISTWQLKLPFTLVKSIVISFTRPETRRNFVGQPREGWKFIDDIPAKDKCGPRQGTKLPIILHYCQTYAVGKWLFDKYRIKENILDCEKSLLKPPPRNLAMLNYTYYIEPPGMGPQALKHFKEKEISLKEPEVRSTRVPFMVCAMTKAVNKALIYHKKNACIHGGNQVKNYTVYNDPYPN